MRKEIFVYPASIKELEQRISQVSTGHNSLLNATSSAQDDAKVIKDFENPTLEAEKIQTPLPLTARQV